MRVLVGCEFSGTVRDAFLRRGHDAVSCDLLPTESPGPHIQGDVRDALRSETWDLGILHPSCRYTTVAGNRWLKDNPERQQQQKESLAFIKEIWDMAPKRAALEQPVSVTSRVLGPATQTIQPWQFGHGETKATCLWLRALPSLRPTNIVPGREARVHRMAPSPNRWKDRSRTYLGIAEAMAEQWGHGPIQELLDGV